MKQIWEYAVTWSYLDHVQAGSQDPGIDFGLYFNQYTPVEAGTVIFVGVDPNSKNPINGSLAQYIIIRGNSGDHFYVHNSEQYVKVGQYVTTDTVIAKSGDSGYTFGAHLHYALKQNGRYVDPTSFINSLKGLNINNQNMSEFVTVQEEWGLSHVALAAGYPDYGTVAAWERIYNLNQGWRGATNWQQLNARIGAGDKLRVREAQQPTTAPQPQIDSAKVQELQNKLTQLEQEKAREKENLLNQLIAEKKEKEEALKQLQESRVKVSQNQEELAQNDKKIAELTEEIHNLNQLLKIEFNLDFEPDSLIIDVAKDVASGQGNIFQRIWNSKTVRSLTRYDWKYILFSLIPLLMLFPEKVELMLGITGFAATAKIILDRVGDYLRITGDRNKDGEFNLSDTDQLKNYRL